MQSRESALLIVRVDTGTQDACIRVQLTRLNEHIHMICTSESFGVLFESRFCCSHRSELPV